jgi:hypothetical protein
MSRTSAIDHRAWKTELPVRSVVLKPCAGRLVVGWVTTSEYLRLIVFDFLHSLVSSHNGADSRSADELLHFRHMRFFCDHASNM